MVNARIASVFDDGIAQSVTGGMQYVWHAVPTDDPFVSVYTDGCGFDASEPPASPVLSVGDGLDVSRDEELMSSDVP